jgi:hypothetical protein
MAIESRSPLFASAAAVEKLETAHYRSICPIGDAGAISTVRHKQINVKQRHCGCTSPHTLESWSIGLLMPATTNR